MPRNVLITGGTDGIGYELVKRLIMKHQLIVVGRTPHDEFRELESLTSNLIFVKTDLANPQKATKDIEKAMVKAKWDHVDNAILNAGTGFVGDPVEEDAEKLRQTLDVNLAANIAICSMLYNRLQKVKGKITFIGSRAHTGKADFASYAASKAGLHGFARALYSEWKGIIDIQIMHIGPVRTDMHRKAGLKLGFIREFFTTPKTMADMIEKAIPSKKFTTKLSMWQEWSGANFFSQGLK